MMASGSSCAYRSRSIATTAVPAATCSAAAMSSGAGTWAKDSTSVRGCRCACSRSSYRLLSSTCRRTRARATWVPTPRLRISSPLLTRCWIAWRMVGKGDLVLQPGAGRQLAGLDQLLEPLGHLEVQRHGAGPVDSDQGGYGLHGRT